MEICTKTKDYIIVYDNESTVVVCNSFYFDRAECNVEYANDSFNETKSYRHPIIAYHKLSNDALDIPGAIKMTHSDINKLNL